MHVNVKFCSTTRSLLIIESTHRHMCVIQKQYMQEYETQKRRSRTKNKNVTMMRKSDNRGISFGYLD